MRKLLPILLLSLNSWAATTYYACSDAGNINDASKFGNTQSGTCACVGSTTFATIPVAVTGDTLSANKCTTTITVNVDPGDDTHQAVLISDATAGGTPATNAFTLASATCDGWAGGAGQAAKTLHANRIGGQKSALSLTGSTGTCTLSGTSTGGAASGASGTVDTHTVVTVTQTGAMTGGGATNAVGYFLNNTGPMTVTGTATASTGTGAYGFYHNSTGAVALTGDCVGSDSGNVPVGCYAASTGIITVTGNLIDGKRGSAIDGTYRWTPGATNYRCVPYDSTYAIGSEDCTHTAGAPLVGSQSAHAIMLIPDASGGAAVTIGVLSNVKSGVVTAAGTGTLSGAGASGSAH